MSPRLTGIADRVVDLLPVARSCWYHRDQRGSWSIKAVLPTIADDPGYASLEVKDGNEAQQAYLEAIADSTSCERRASLDAALRAYCAKDTEAMMALARFLGGEQQNQKNRRRKSDPSLREGSPGR